MKINSLCKSKYQVIYVLVAIILLSSCVRNAPSIKSADDLKSRKILVGRFDFYANGKPSLPRYVSKLESDRDKRRERNKRHEFSFTVILSNGKRQKLMLDEQGYVCIPVDVGRYYISEIRRTGSPHQLWLRGQHETLASSRELRFRTLGTGINIQNSDTVVNFGTIKVEHIQSTSAKAVDVAVLPVEWSWEWFLSVPLRINSGKRLWIPSLTGPIGGLRFSGRLQVTQTKNFEEPRNYISSKFSILPELIRDETILFSKELEGQKQKVKKDNLAPVFVTKDSNVYHRQNCSSLDATKGLLEFSSSQQVRNAGGVPCSNCNP
jgi:hypothetical protein